MELVEPPAWAVDAAIAGIEAMHTADYVDALRTGADAWLASSQGFDWDPGIWAMAVHSTAGVIAATESAVADGVAGSLSSGLHHAKPGTGDGFCTVNGLAIAAQRLAAPDSQVVILDLDAHCGGGTQQMLAAHDLHDQVRSYDLSTSAVDTYVPTHPDDRFVLMDGDDDTYLSAVESMLDDIAWDRARIVLYNAGMDPHPEVSKLALTIRERMVFERAAAEHVPIAWVLAGGYTWGRTTMDDLVDLHWLTIEAAASIAR